MDTFNSFVQIMDSMVIILVVAAVILGVVVLYNLGIMSYVERSRELATLKVLGFRNRTIGKLLISQNIWLTGIGVIIGLPAGTKVKVTETNDTKDIYSVSVQGNGTPFVMKKGGSDTVNPSNTSVSVGKDETAEMNAAFLIKTLTENGDQIVVTNTLRDISVTGLLFDIAPFIFITATGIILLALYMNGKRKNDAEHKI
jgi:ABC-type antimicrobial peptide transport system permease subunit